MSREGANTAAGPQAPTFTARFDEERGAVRVRGRLDRFGAEYLCDGLAALVDLGHRRLTVRLDGPASADAGILLAELAVRLRSRGVRLTVG